MNKELIKETSQKLIDTKNRLTAVRRKGLEDLGEKVKGLSK